ncbi:Peptidase family M28 [Ekhidna lutea]|uniref:Peptidase family M28 n=1 Tax=Ekhidna lutea TaxID=447679 RepID=A0A239M837_EKHLU|nr:M28 family metallopeptidase [Ekhidna lutea]SNT38283.1 Peptidase family M28 [Ekhidna lutea]
MPNLLRPSIVLVCIIALLELPAQSPYEIIENVSSERIEKDIQTLVSFGTRHTMSETESDTRGIGAARRWIKSEFEKISEACGGCYEVSMQRTLEKGNAKTRITKDTEVVNVLAIKRGTKYPNRYVVMAGDIDSRISDPLNYTDDSPGANDNASGMAGVIEAARVLSNYEFESSILLVGLSGEEQGLYGGKHLAAKAVEEEWEIIGFLNNDMIGNIEGVDGVIDNRTFRIFSEPTNPTDTDFQQRMRRYYGGEVDGISRQLARYVYKMTKAYMPEMNPKMIYRLDRFGRGGHHRPFCDAGFAGVRIMEAHENYTQQHQDIREEDGIKYGDVIEHVNFDYASKLTAVNAITLAALASAPSAPKNVAIGGAVQPATTLYWDEINDENLAGYKVYFRETTSPTWDMSYNVDKDKTEFTLKGIVIDNYFFGVSAVGKDGNESLVVFPGEVKR